MHQNLHECHGEHIYSLIDPNNIKFKILLIFFKFNFGL